MPATIRKRNESGSERASRINKREENFALCCEWLLLTNYAMPFWGCSWYWVEGEGSIVSFFDNYVEAWSGLRFNFLDRFIPRTNQVWLLLYARKKCKRCLLKYSTSFITLKTAIWNGIVRFFCWVPSNEELCTISAIACFSVDRDSCCCSCCWKLKNVDVDDERNKDEANEDKCPELFITINEKFFHIYNRESIRRGP